MSKNINNLSEKFKSSNFKKESNDDNKNDSNQLHHSARQKFYSEDELIKIGAHLKFLRNKNKMTQSKLIRLSNIDRVAHIEIGSYKTVTPSILRKLCFFLNVDYDEFLLEAFEKNVAIATVNPIGSLQRNKIYKEELVGEDFIFEWQIEEDCFYFRFLSTARIVLFEYKGKKYKQNDFLIAMEEAAKCIKKAI